MSNIVKNIKKINDQIKAAAVRSGRNPNEITLVAVSKRHPADFIREAYEAGQRNFGENYAQELRDKAMELSDLPDIRWHFIGHLQSNKAKYVAPSITLMETVDKASLVTELSRQAARFNRTIECLVQVNVGGEEQKSGCSPNDMEELLTTVEQSEGVTLNGLMTIPPWKIDTNAARVYFAALAKLRQEHGGAARLPHLSMGMSQDFEIAIEEGATLVRVGTAIFGERPAKVKA